MEHTEGKWETGSICDWEIWVGADIHIADVHGNLPTRYANAQRICQCVNSHDDLLDACEDLLSCVGDELSACDSGEIENHPTLKAHSDSYDNAKAVIVKAK